jgi:hypothetical protein
MKEKAEQPAIRPQSDLNCLYFRHDDYHLLYQLATVNFGVMTVEPRATTSPRCNSERFPPIAILSNTKR